MKFFRRKSQPQEEERTPESSDLKNKEVVVGSFYGGMSYSPQMDIRKTFLPKPSSFSAQDTVSGKFYGGVKCSPVVQGERKKASKPTASAKKQEVVSSTFFAGTLCPER